MQSIVTSLSLADRSLILRGPATAYQLQRAEELAFQFWENYQPGQKISDYCLLCENREPMMTSLLVEGVIRRNLGNFIQMAMAWAVKVGGKVGLAGGVPLGEIGEVAVDAFFAAEAVVATISAIKDLVTGAIDDIKNLFKQFTTLSLSDGPKAIYSQVQQIISDFIDNFSLQEGDDTELDAEGILASFTDSISLIIDKASQVVGDAIAVVIPIPGADVAVAEGLIALGNEAYSIVSWIFDKIPDTLKDIFTKKGLVTEFLNGVIDSCIEFAENNKEEQEKEKSAGDVAKGLAASLFPPAAMAKAAGQVSNLLGVTDKIIEFLNSTGRDAAEKMGEAFSKIVPFMFGCLAGYQIVNEGDYGEEEQIEETFKRIKNNTTLSHNRSKAMKLTRRKLRRIIKEACGSAAFADLNNTVSTMLQTMQPQEVAAELRGLADDVEASANMMYEVDVDLNDDGKDDVSVTALGGKETKKGKGKDMR